ncbi:MAG: glucokinase [Chromatiales bacterium]|jgi:glucokinase
MQILAADVGGTNTRLAHYQVTSTDNLEMLDERVFSSTAATNLSDIFSQFLDQLANPRIERACIGIAGPVVNQTCNTTNLPWRVSAAHIREHCGFEQVWLLNDLEANAWGIEALQESDFFTLNSGREQDRGNRSIISAGTGLGEAGIIWNGQAYQPFASEGGHTDFSPATALEFELHQWLAERYGHVSWERLVSGLGLENIYHFLLEYRGLPIPEEISKLIAQRGVAPAVSHAALEGRDPICLQTLDLFLHLYGREAGNHALKLMASGGVYLGGGIAPRILSRLKNGSFLQAFFDKGRMRPLMEAMPVRVILNDKAALLGAARCAALQ